MKTINEIAKEVYDRYSYIEILDIKNIESKIVEALYINNFTEKKLYNAAIKYCEELKCEYADKYLFVNIEKIVKESLKNSNKLSSYINTLNKIVIMLENFDSKNTIDLFYDFLGKCKDCEALLDKIVEINPNINDSSLSKNTKELIEAYAMTKNVEDNKEEEDNFELVESNNCSKDFDMVKIYLKDIGTIPLLSAEEEQEIALLYIETKNKKYKDKLVNSNLRLVVSIAKKYIGQGLSFLDLIQEGNLGLMTAIDRFDPRKGFKLSTYATWWIRQSITRGIDNKSRNIRVPVHYYELIIKYSDAKNRIAARVGREPSSKELALEMGFITEDELYDSNRLHAVLEKIRNLEALSIDTISMNSKIGPDADGEDEIGDFLASDDISPEAQAVIRSEREYLIGLLDRLPDRIRGVMMLRYGLYDGHQYTLEETADKLYEMGYDDHRVTRERIRQIEAKGLRKLKHIALLQKCEANRAKANVKTIELKKIKK